MFTLNKQLAVNLSPSGGSNNVKGSKRLWQDNKAVFNLIIDICWKGDDHVTFVISGDTFGHNGLIERSGAEFFLTKDSSESKLNLVSIFFIIKFDEKD